MTKSSFSTTLSRLRPMLTPSSRRQFVVLCILNMGMILFEIAVAGSISLLGVAMASPASLANSSLISILSYYLPLMEYFPPQLCTLIYVMGLVALTTLCKNLLLAKLTWQQSAFAQSVAWVTGTHLFSRMLHAPYIWHVEQNSAELTTLIGWRNYIANYLVNILNLFIQSIVSIFLLATALYIAPLMSIFLFSIISIIAIILYKFTRHFAYLTGQKLQKYDLYAARISLQGLQGIREILIADKQKEFIKAYTINTESYIHTASTQSLFAPMPIFVLESLGMFLLLAVIILLSRDEATVAEVSGTLTLLAGISWRLLPAANKGLGALLALKTLQPITEQLLDKQEITPSLPYAEARLSITFTNSLELKNISFAYPEAQQAALRDVSLRIPRKGMIGLVGLSGSGKSTLTNIITGLMEPTSGQILLDGKPWDRATTRLSLGYVPQQLYLLDASLTDNIAFHIQKSDVDIERVRKCCQMAAMDFISDMPHGLDTLLGERGIRLSGGQIQRVGIARALYCQPSLLIFDEATSALDGATEEAIQQTIESLREHMTMLIIAHRLSTVKNCDYIYWLHDGVIHMQGTPDKVLPAYSDFLKVHAKYVLEGHSHE